MMIILRIAFRNVWKNWRHSVASIVSVSAAFLTLALFQGYLLDIDNLFSSIYRHRIMFGDVILEHKDVYSYAGRTEPWKYSIDEAGQSFISEFVDRNKSMVDATVRFLKVHGLATNGSTSIIFSGSGYDLLEGAKTRGDRWGVNALYGDTLDGSENPAGVVVGQIMAARFGCRPDRKREYSSLVKKIGSSKIAFHCDEDQRSLQISATTDDGQLNAIDLDIVGLVDGGFKDIDSQYVNMSLENAQMLLGTKNISYQTFLLKDPEMASEFIQKIDKEAQLRNLPFKVQTWKEHPFYGDAYIRTMDLLAIFRNFVVAIVLTIATLSVLNTMVKVVTERTREIGTLRSLGYQRYQVLLMFVLEAAGLSFLGNAVGLIAAVLVSLVINHSGLVYKAGMYVEPAGFTIAMEPRIYIISFIYLSILSMLASVFALRVTLKRKVSENLCYA